MDAVDLKSVFELAGFNQESTPATVLAEGQAAEPEVGPDPIPEAPNLYKQTSSIVHGVMPVAAFRSSDGHVHTTRTGAYEWEAKLLLEEITGARIVRSPGAVAEGMRGTLDTLRALLAETEQKAA
nr:hypothetical protein [uncultured Cohaesibacter sp.]